MKALITGGTGALGKSLQKVFPQAFFPTRADMDITNPVQIKETILEYKPRILIHTAALVNVRECEENKQKAWQTNVQATQHIIDALNELNNNCYFLYVSTACVFAGEKEKFYTERDIPSPKNYYAFTKVCSEQIVKQYKNHCIVRTNFVPKQKWKYPKAFVDRFGTYLFSDQVAQAIKEVIDASEQGIIHIVGDTRMSMFELAKRAGSEDVGELTLNDYQGPPVTVDMSLSTKRWKKYTIQ